MSTQSELHYGQIETVLEILDWKKCDEGELRAALINAFRRIDDLEKQVSNLLKNMEAMK